MPDVSGAAARLADVRMRIARLLLPILLLPVLAACTGDSATTSPGVPTPAPSGVDPLVPYSPAPTPFVERTTGFIPDTLTLPTADGGKLFVTPVTTTMTTTYVHDTRALAVYLEMENPGDAAWTGTVGTDAQVTDLTGAVFAAVPPAPGDLHPDPQRYGGSNRSLLKPVTVQPGTTASGALVFHVTGGNRPITLRISLDGGATWGEWATNLGVF
jgi:hypothetical protein